MRFTYHVEGMHCNSCVEKIKSALSPHFRVIDITFNPPMLQIEAEHPPSLSDLVLRITTVGKYNLHPITKTNDQAQLKNVSGNDQKGLMTYYPIILIAAYIFGVTAISNFHS